MIVEGVTYHRFRVRYTLSDGRRRCMTRWAPALVYAREAVLRELVERFGLEGIKANSVTIRIDPV